MKYRHIFQTVSDINEQTQKQMAAIYFKNYDGSNESLFYDDLASKDEVLLLYFENTLVGFTTLKIYDYIWLNKPIKILYSGDTIVERQHWGQQTLAFAWIKRMGKIKREDPLIPLYWFLLVKGHRTFRYMPVFGKSFYPHWSINRNDLKPLADTLAEEKFGTDYNPNSGIVEFPESRGHLKTDIAKPSPEELTKESVQFFLARNPGYIQGHELVCICEIEEHNMKPLTKRLFRQS